MRSAWLVVAIEVLSIVSAFVGGAALLVALMGQARSEAASVALAGLLGFVALRAVALALRLLDDIRRAVLKRAGADATEQPSWRGSP